MRKEWIGIKKILTMGAAAILVLVLISGVVFQKQIRSGVANKLVEAGNHYYGYGSAGHFNPNRAEKLYDLATRINPKADKAYYQLARIHLVENKFNQGRQEIDQSLAINPQNQRAFYIRGLIDGYDNKYQDAISDFQKFVAWAPTEWAGYNDLAWAYFLNKDFESSKEIAQVGLNNVDENNPWLLNALGVAYINLGKPDKAQPFFDKAKSSANKLTVGKWVSAYPGNDPSGAVSGLAQFKTNLDSNSKLASAGFISGGVSVSACGSSYVPPVVNPPAPPSPIGNETGPGNTCDCSGSGGVCRGHPYINSCGKYCLGSYWPGCGDTSKYCGTYQTVCHKVCHGTMSPNCSNSGNVCRGVPYTSLNGCGNCTGTKDPSCPYGNTVCAGIPYASTNGCGSCVGHKQPDWKYVCSYVDEDSCDQTNCGKSDVVTKKAYCTAYSNNECGSTHAVALSNCGSTCVDQKTTCSACSWREVVP